MTMEELRALLEGYADDAEVLVFNASDNRHYPIQGVDVQEWGTRFEVVITEKEA